MVTCQEERPFLKSARQLRSLIDWTGIGKDQWHLSKLVKAVQNQDGLNDCYDSVYNGHHLNILNMTLNDLIYKYFNREENFGLLTSPMQAAKRFRILLENIKNLLLQIQDCMRKPLNERTRLGLTWMSQLSQQEYLSMLNPELTIHNVSMLTGLKSSTCPYPKIRERNLPSHFNWVYKGMVTSVKNQFHCGSCFIFAALATVESTYLIKNKGKVKAYQVDYSEQAVLDCLSRKNVCENGGRPSEVYRLLATRGVVDDHYSPYLGHQRPDNCRKYPSSKHACKVRYWCHARHLSDYQMQAYLWRHGPVYAAVDAADSKEWINLKGPFKGYCGKDTNHAVVLVGWTPTHWILKNSWGDSWGVNGFLYLRRGENKCGVNNFIGYARIRLLN